MKKRLKLSAMTVFFAMLLGFAVMSIGTEQAFAMAGNGTAENPYEISTYADLKQFADIVNGANGETKNTAACAILTEDIDASSSGDWVPIGKWNDPYTGTFDGNSKTIEGLSNGDSKDNNQGLFGGIGSAGTGSAGTVKSVTLKNVSIQGKNAVGGVVGRNYGTIENCHTTGTVSGSDGNIVGGVVGRNYGKIENCSNAGDVNISVNCHNIGGVAGDNSGTITNCYNTGTVTGDSDVGGVAGNNGSGTINNCYNTGAVTGNGNYIGGVAGNNASGTINNCYNTESVSGANVVGGVAGLNRGTVENCYNTGAVTGHDYVGGVAGYNGAPSGSITIENCYNTGAVTGNDYVGGVAGINGNTEYYEEGTIIYCYYDKNVCELAKAIGGRSYGTVTNVTGLSTAEMTGTTCTAYDSWENFYAVWKLTDSYPILDPHDHVLTYEKEQSCEEPAHIEGYTCSFCGKHYSDEEGKNLIPDAKWRIIPATGHTWSDEWSTDGDSHWRECTVCHAKKDEAAHTWSDEWSTDGDSHWHECGVCHRKKDEVVHDWSDEWSTDGDSHWRECTVCHAKKDEAAHTWDGGKVTKPATVQSEGEMTFTCTECEATMIKTIDKLKPSGTPTAKVKAGKKSLTVGWGRIDGAEGYDIFFARCNHSGKKIVSKKVKSIKGNNIFKWTKSGLKKGTAYKSYVRAYVMKDGKKTYISKSPIMHAYTGNVKGKYTNAKAVKVNKTRVTLKNGKTFKIKAKVTKVKKNKKLFPSKHVKKLRYLSSDKTVATVTGSGKIIAKGEGTCTIVAFAHNGVSKSIKVVVK